MEDYQRRVIDEKKGLDSRINKLSAFIVGDVFSALSADKRRLLNLQCKVMREYSTILDDRIETF